MNQIFTHPVFIGGIIPMIAFGVYNAMLKPLSMKLSIDSLMFGVLVGIFLTTVIYSLFWGEGTLSKDVQTSEFWWSAVVGVIWAVAVIAINISLGKMGGNVAQIAPVINAAGFVSLIIALVVFKEAVILWKVITGAALIFIGTLFLL